MLHSKLKYSDKVRVSTIDGCPLGGMLGSLTGYALFEVVLGGETVAAWMGDETETDTLCCLTCSSVDDVETVV